MTHDDGTHDTNSLTHESDISSVTASDGSLCSESVRLLGAAPTPTPTGVEKKGSNTAVRYRDGTNGNPQQQFHSVPQCSVGGMLTGSTQGHMMMAQHTVSTLGGTGYFTHHNHGVSGVEFAPQMQNFSQVRGVVWCDVV